MFRIRQRVLNTTVGEKIYKRWSRLVARKFTKLILTEIAEVPNLDE